jgi:hypothetical protein
MISGEYDVVVVGAGNAGARAGRSPLGEIESGREPVLERTGDGHSIGGR